MESLKSIRERSRGHIREQRAKRELGGTHTLSLDDVQESLGESSKRPLESLEESKKVYA